MYLDTASEDMSKFFYLNHKPRLIWKENVTPAYFYVEVTGL
jgi:hypothetical protein